MRPLLLFVNRKDEIQISTRSMRAGSVTLILWRGPAAVVSSRFMAFSARPRTGP